MFIINEETRHMSIIMKFITKGETKKYMGIMTIFIDLVTINEDNDTFICLANKSI